MKGLSIRWRLTLWYGGVLAVVLATFSMVVWVVMRHRLLQRVDQGLAEEFADVRYEVERAADCASLLEWLDRRFARHEGFDFQITQTNGERFFVNPRFADKSLLVPQTSTVGGVPRYESVSFGIGRWRVICAPVSGPDGPLTVQVARPLASFDHESSELLLIFLMTGPLTLLVAVSGGYFLACRALAPVQNMTRTANEISAERLNQRLTVDNPDDELGALAQTLNRMIERLERSFMEMQRFTADAAHELRTPLAVIRNEAEVALRSTRTVEVYSQVLENLLEETNRLSNLADQLLFLCRQDAGLQPARRERVAMDSLLKEVKANMELVAQIKGIGVSLEGECHCEIMADGSQLRRVFYNLLDNAIKYTEPGGWVSILSGSRNGRVLVTIKDTGIGISAEHLPRVFDRFYRVDPARTGENGTGLGLALCLSIVKGFGGEIVVDSEVGKGTTFVVTIPADDRE